jgi:TP901 family phage tail tape measure protein
MITGRSMSDSVEDITAVMTSFGMTARDTGRILDSLVAIDLRFAITTDVMVAAIRKAGPVAAQMNISFERLLGVITATHLATRASGGEIGNAWKTIFTRMSTTAVDAIQSIGQIPIYLNDLKQPTKENTGTFRDWSDVIDDLANKLPKLNESSQAQLTAQIAGVRQVTKLIAMFRQYQVALDATTEAQLGYGKGQEAVNILLETTEVKLKKVQNAWAVLMNTILNRCNVESLILSRELNLPSPIPLPKVNIKNKE